MLKLLSEKLCTKGLHKVCLKFKEYFFQLSKLQNFQKLLNSINADFLMNILVLLMKHNINIKQQTMLWEDLIEGCYMVDRS